MPKKILSIVAITLSFIFIIIFYVPYDKEYKVIKVNSPVCFQLNDEIFEIKDLQTFDSKFTKNNIELAKKLNITENEAFILGHLAKNWTINLMQGRKVYKKNSDLVYYNYSFRKKYLYSGFCLINSEPYYKQGFDKKLKEIRRIKYKVIDIDTGKIYNPDDNEVKNLENLLLVRKSHLPKIYEKESPSLVFIGNNIKVFLTDFTSKYKPDRDCSTLMCREIVNNINFAKKTIDIAIYGYSEVPAIEDSLQKALNRGVKIRLIYDLDNAGKSTYPDIHRITSLVSDNKSDFVSSESRYLMHNKFLIFDEKVLITGSANLSHTDMSGFNSNSILVINSEKIAKIYKNEFEQMYKGKFHDDKDVIKNKNTSEFGDKLKIYFSPKDKAIENIILPLIKNAKIYIYIPAFVLTEKRITEELIKAKSRGVDIRVIMDALNASIRHSKHKELRAGGILLKTENYAGKMHSKSMIIDDEYTVIGSMNFSNSGENKNDENLVVIKDPEIAKFYKSFFLYQWDKIDNKWLKFNVRAEGKDSIGSCFDGLDNNYDGLADSADLACK